MAPPEKHNNKPQRITLPTGQQHTPRRAPPSPLQCFTFPLTGCPFGIPDPVHTVGSVTSYIVQPPLPFHHKHLQVPFWAEPVTSGNLLLLLPELLRMKYSKFTTPSLGSTRPHTPASQLSMCVLINTQTAALWDFHTTVESSDCE